MSNFYSFDLGSHHAIVMFYPNAQAAVPACIMGTFASDNKDSDGSYIRLAVVEDQHAIEHADYEFTKETFEEYIESESKNIGMELLPVAPYDDLKRESVFRLSLGLISHNLHDYMSGVNNIHNYVDELNKIALNSSDPSIRHGIIDALYYARTRIEAVYNITEWYYEED